MRETERGRRRRRRRRKRCSRKRLKASIASGHRPILRYPFRTITEERGGEEERGWVGRGEKVEGNGGGERERERERERDREEEGEGEREREI